MSLFPTSWFNTFGIKVSCKVILSLLMDIIKHSQSSRSNKFSMSLEYLKKEVRDGVHFLHADKHQSFYKLALSYLMEVAREMLLKYFCNIVRHRFCDLLQCKTFRHFMGVQSFSLLLVLIILIMIANNCYFIKHWLKRYIKVEIIYNDKKYQIKRNWYQKL